MQVNTGQAFQQSAQRAVEHNQLQNVKHRLDGMILLRILRGLDS